MDDGEKKKKRRNRIFIICGIIGGVLVSFVPFIFIFILAMNDGILKFEVKDNGVVEIDSNNLQISSGVVAKYDEDSKCYEISGQLINLKNKDYDYINLSYKIYDDDDYILGHANAYIDKLNKKEKWRFKAQYCESDAASASKYELDAVETMGF